MGDVEARMGEEAELEEDFTWKIELETALFEEAEIGTLRNIARGRPVPEHLRVDFWKVRCRHSTFGSGGEGRGESG